MYLVLCVTRDRGPAAVRPQLGLASLHVTQRELQWLEHGLAPEDI